MADEITTFYSRTQEKCDTEANWEAANPVLLKNEVIYIKTADGDTRTKTGDGTSKYKSLPFNDKNFREKVGKKSEAKTYTVSVPTTGWTTTTLGSSTIYTKTITVTGITANDTPIVDVVLSDTVDTAKKQLEAYGCISRITTAANSITISCYESAPTAAFTIQLLNITNRQ